MSLRPPPQDRSSDRLRRGDTQPLPGASAGVAPARGSAPPAWVPPPYPGPGGPGAGYSGYGYSGYGGGGYGGGGYGGAGGGGHAPWQPSGSSWQPPRPPEPTKHRIGTILLIIGAILLGGLVAVVGVELTSNHSACPCPAVASSPKGAGGVVAAATPSPSPFPTPSPTPAQVPVVPSPVASPLAPLLGTSEPDLPAVEARVEPGVVDVNSNLGGGATAAGTGMILTSGGEVLTNNHVIVGALSTTVELTETGQTFPATVVGTNKGADVAVLQLQGASGLPTVPIGNSSTVAFGDAVVAIGNALGLNGLPSVSQGRVVALNQSITASDPSSGTSENLTGLIQTSAPLQPGDSGGPLVNVAGQVVGMDTAASDGFRFSSAAAFSIPINTAVAVAAQLEAGTGNSSAPAGGPGFLGIEAASVQAMQQSTPGYRPPVSQGAFVASVIAGEPAAEAGIIAGDIITSINGTAVTSPSSLTTILSLYHPGQTVQVDWVDPAGSPHSAAVPLAVPPPN